MTKLRLEFGAYLGFWMVNAWVLAYIGETAGYPGWFFVLSFAAYGLAIWSIGNLVEERLTGCLKP